MRCPLFGDLHLNILPTCSVSEMLLSEQDVSDLFRRNVGLNILQNFNHMDMKKRILNLIITLAMIESGNLQKMTQKCHQIPNFNSRRKKF